ncbi:MAG: GGDEF domain-containing protein, partial [Zetaproteobacteria bacterium]
AQLVRSQIRTTDSLFRMGGEEFLILLSNTSLNEAVVIAKKIRNSVANDLNTLKDRKITISVGVAEMRKQDSADSLFKRADKLLYQSKHSGKNKVTY